MQAAASSGTGRPTARAPLDSAVTGVRRRAGLLSGEDLFGAGLAGARLVGRAYQPSAAASASIAAWSKCQDGTGCRGATGVIVVRSYALTRRWAAIAWTRAATASGVGWNRVPAVHAQPAEVPVASASFSAGPWPVRRRSLRVDQDAGAGAPAGRFLRRAGQVHPAVFQDRGSSRGGGGLLGVPVRRRNLRRGPAPAAAARELRLRPGPGPRPRRDGARRPRRPSPPHSRRSRLRIAHQQEQRASGAICFSAVIAPTTWAALRRRALS